MDVTTTISAPSRATVPNPFPVYPVSSLREIVTDILDRTVFTEAVVALDAAVQDYVKRAAAGKRSGLAIPVRGDYGTGKTHLLLLAQARLRSAWPGGPAEVTVLLAPATEAPFSVWYLTVVAPLLDRLGVPRLFANLLATAACEVADQVPLTAEIAVDIRKDPLEVYPVLRQGLLSSTDVERALLRAVAVIAPRGSEELRAVLAALAWPQRQEPALRWLAGRELDPTERELLGVTRNLDAEAEAAAVLVAIAGAAWHGGGLFALMVDEFEHLMAEDQRTSTHRNATTVKRLLEGMAGMGALVLVAGHWRAWEQLPDFKARFGGQPPVDLVTLTGKEIGQLVVPYAPDWGRRLDEAALETIAEAGGRNIRRVMAVLYQLHADTAGGNGPIGVAVVERAAEARRQLAAETGRPDAVIEEAVRVAGGQVTRNEALFGRLRFDLVARRGEELRLVADIRHAATSVELTRLLDDFSIALGALRLRHPSVRGLLVATGAVDRATLALLDAVAGVEALPGEGPGWEAALSSAVTAALRANMTPPVHEDTVTLAQEEEARDRLREARMVHAKVAAETRSRLDEIDFGPNERGVAATALARGTAPEVSTSVYGPDTLVLDSFSESMRAQVPSILSLAFMPQTLPMVMFVPIALIASFYFSFSPFLSESAYPERLRSLFIISAFGCSVMTVFFLAYLYQVERRAFVRYQRWGRQKLEELVIMGTPSDELLRVKNRLIDAPDAAGGFRRAFRHVTDVLPPPLRDDITRSFTP